MQYFGHQLPQWLVCIHISSSDVFDKNAFQNDSFEIILLKESISLGANNLKCHFMDLFLPFQGPTQV